MSLISSSLERASFLVKPERALSDEKTKKKRTTTTVGCSFSLCLFRALFFLSFFRDVSTLAFLHFFNRNEESFRQSLSLDTIMQSIQSTVVVEVRFKFSLSLLNSLFLPLSSKTFCFVSRSLLPSPKLPSSFGKSRSV